MRYFLILILSLMSVKSFAKEGKTVCLNMIVKDESRVIERCLKSVLPLIDYWVIVDTGSSDGTQKIIKSFMKDIPGELYERPWVNFAHNRNEALMLAKNKGDYILIIDADEQLLYDKDFVKPELVHDFYDIMTRYGGTEYVRRQLISTRLDWVWQGVVHEYLSAPNIRSKGLLTKVVNFVLQDGARSQDPEKFYKDALLLEEDLKKNPNNVRSVFYLAQSYRDAGMKELALENYKKRIQLGGWDQEVYWSLLQVALLQQALNMSSDLYVQSFYKAYHYRPNRIEPLYHLTRHYRLTENYLMGYLLAKHAKSIPPSKDLLFVEKWINEWGIEMEMAVCAFYLEMYEEAKALNEKLLNHTSLPDDVREQCLKNLTWALLEIAKKNKRGEVVSQAA